MKSVFALGAFEQIYGGAAFERIGGLTDVIRPPMSAEALLADGGALAECEALFTGWGAPVLDAALLARAPRLRAVFYGAGSLRGTATDAFWESGIPICSAWRANAVPVAEVSYALIALYLKKVPQLAAGYRRDPAARDELVRLARPAGLFEGVAGLVSLGAIGSLVAERLRAANIKTLAHDPYLQPERARQLGVEQVALPELFERSDVVSLHTPLLRETAGMIGADLLERMKPGAALVNTARGALVNEADLAAVLQKRPDLSAFLDVTWPEPVPPDSPLWRLPNLALTPHIAGSIGNEARRHGQLMADECERFLNGEPFLCGVTREQAEIMA